MGPMRSLRRHTATDVINALISRETASRSSGLMVIRIPNFVVQIHFEELFVRLAFVVFEIIGSFELACGVVGWIDTESLSFPHIPNHGKCRSKILLLNSLNGKGSSRFGQ